MLQHSRVLPEVTGAILNIFNTISLMIDTKDIFFLPAFVLPFETICGDTTFIEIASGAGLLITKKKLLPGIPALPVPGTIRLPGGGSP